MKKSIVATSLVILMLSGCAVYPAQPVQYGYQAPSGVAYVQPYYTIPGPGYVWLYNPNYGWGWHHPQYGWHRGWR